MNNFQAPFVTNLRLTCIAILGGLSVASVAAQDQHVESRDSVLTDEQRVEKLVVLNETGILSITYAEPWFYEVAEYATSLANTLDEEVALACQECQDLLSDMQSQAKPRLDLATLSVIQSMMSNNGFEYKRVLSSLLRKYSDLNDVDVESNGDSGQYWPFEGNECKKESIDQPSLIQQMFPLPTDPRMIGGAVWAENMCTKIDALVECLSKVKSQNDENEAINQSESGNQVGLSPSSTFSEVKTATNSIP